MRWVDRRREASGVRLRDDIVMLSWREYAQIQCGAQLISLRDLESSRTDLDIQAFGYFPSFCVDFDALYDLAVKGVAIASASLTMSRATAPVIFTRRHRPRIPSEVPDPCAIPTSGGCT